MTPTTFDQVLAAARQLPPRERARLVAVVVEELVTVPAPPRQNQDSWAQLDAFIDDFHATYPDADPAAQLLADRRARDEGTHVHD